MELAFPLLHFKHLIKFASFFFNCTQAASCLSSNHAFDVYFDIFIVCVRSCMHACVYSCMCVENLGVGSLHPLCAILGFNLGLQAITSDPFHSYLILPAQGLKMGESVRVSFSQQLL